MSTAGRSRSLSTSSRSAIDSREAPLALNGSGNEPSWREAINGNSRHYRDEDLVAGSYASQHTLKTIRGPSSPVDSDEYRQRETGGDHIAATTGNGEHNDGREIRRGNPQFIIDLGTPTNELNNETKTRGRSDTFGGVVLPQGPASHTPSKFDASQIRVQQRPSLARQDTDTSLSSLPSSLRLGGGSGDTFSDRRPILASALKALALFLLCLLGLYITLHALLPPLDDEHRGKVKLPRSFADLKELNEILQVYKDRNYARVLGCYVTVYLFIQAFSIPGSMYLSILGGAMYGVLMAMPLVCFCVATGALICYYISALLGPAILLNSERWQARVDAWSDRVSAHRENLVSYLIVIRIAPLPPHWLVNVVAPHLGISVWVFWISTFFGIAGVSYIHTTIGTTLDQMTSSSDFNLLSWQNGLGLGGIIVAVLVPVVLRRVYSKDLEQAAEDPADENGPAATRQSISLEPDEDDDPEGRRRGEADSLLPRRQVNTNQDRSGALRPFRLDSPGSSEDEDDEVGLGGDASAAGVASGSRQPDRAWASVGQAGNLDKASKLLGIKVEEPGSGSGFRASQESSQTERDRDAWSGNSPDRVW